MTRAQRRKKISALKGRNKKRGFPWNRILFPFLIVLVLFIYVWLTSGTFRSNEKITVVIGGGDKVYVSVFDKETGTVNNLIIPQGTQLNVARQLGTWRAESVWSLGENEKLPGVLLSETIVKNFKIPVTSWADASFYGISQGGLASTLRGLLPYKTNLGLGDKIKLGLFSLSSPPTKRSTIDLSEEDFLRKTRLVGGGEGYIISENFPQSLYYIFSDSRINSSNLKIEIEDHSDKRGAADIVAGVLEVLGGKAAAITKLEGKDFLCEVSGKDEKNTKTIAHIFGCKISSKMENSNFDLIISIGEEFGKRY